MVLKKIVVDSRGFTLIELLVVIAIIGLLSTLAIVALGTARQKSRDARRLSDLKQIQTALEMYNSETGGYPVTTSTILLGDTAHACLGSNGFNPSGACANQYISFPKDPAGGYYYYLGAAIDYKVSAALEGASGNLSGPIFATPNSGIYSCGSTVSHGGRTYDTVLIGAQCWLKQNLNIGTMINSGTSSTPGNGQIEKWCYNNDSNNCTTDGGLYSWAEANQLPAGCNTGSCTVPVNNQGICPPGWHLPTDGEYKTLEMFIGMSEADANTPGWRGPGLGTKLMIDGSSGFDAELAGLYLSDGSFLYRNAVIHLWTPLEYAPTNVWYRAFGTVYESRILTDATYTKWWGMSVRCLKN